MKIQLGKILMNRTRKYLFPIIKSYGNDFTTVVNSLFKVGIGIGDMIVNKCGIHHEKHLFILVDINVSPVSFLASLNWLKEHPAYEDDYAFDNVKSGRLHMIVIKVPDTYIESLDNFRKSKFSKMYSKEDIVKLFTYKGNDEEQKKIYHDVQKVLIHDHNYRIEYAKCIEKEFNIPKFSPSHIEKDWEYEFPIITEEELFNAKQGEE